jgi:hypothetical protein
VTKLSPEVIPLLAYLQHQAICDAEKQKAVSSAAKAYFSNNGIKGSVATPPYFAVDCISLLFFLLVLPKASAEQKKNLSSVASKLDEDAQFKSLISGETLEFLKFVRDCVSHARFEFPNGDSVKFEEARNSKFDGKKEFTMENITYIINKFAEAFLNPILAKLKADAQQSEVNQ